MDADGAGHTALFRRCSRQVLTELAGALCDELVALWVADADDRVIARIGGDVGCDHPCAAVPVLDPASGRLHGSVTLAGRSGSAPHPLLLALAQAAASAIGALMLAHSSYRHRRSTPRLEPGSGSLVELSASWMSALEQASSAFEQGLVVLAVGEAGAGRSTLLAQAQCVVAQVSWIQSTSPSGGNDVLSWLELKGTEVVTPDSAVVVPDVDALPPRAAARLSTQLGGPTASRLVGFTATRYDDVPVALRTRVGAVVGVAPLRERSDDVMPLVRHTARWLRGREVDITAAAAQALTSHGWPGNVAELVAVVRGAVTHADRVDVRDLPPAVMCGSSRRLSRIETFERDEIIRTLAAPPTTMDAAARALGLSRATLYRKLAQYDIHVPRSS